LPPPSRSGSRRFTSSHLDGIFITELEPGDGIRLAVKDLFDTEDVRTTYGSAVFSDHVPSRTAAAVRLLEAAGYTSVGKTNLHEFAYGTTSQNVHYGTVPNPAAPGRTAGGSSGGSAAALAAGLAEAALGTDSGGSIRIPSACCGTTGLKPTFGLVSTDGVFPLAPSFDHAGPMALDVGGCVEMMETLVPGFSADEVALGDVRAGVAWLDAADPLVRARVGVAAGLLSAEPVELPFATEIQPLFMREVGDVHRELYPEHAELYGENVSPKIERCLAVGDGEAAAAAAAREAYRECMSVALDRFDVVLTPTLGFVAPTADVDEIATREGFIRFTFPFNALGWPALALPCGPAENGLPASVQVVGRPGTDPLILGVGKALERALKP
jgi:aspartyl-tRNA(Asn)/glutamyl-tRNA(Gln) amidotransferase subunit A